MVEAMRESFRATGRIVVPQKLRQAAESATTPKEVRGMIDTIRARARRRVGKHVEVEVEKDESLDARVQRISSAYREARRAQGGLNGTTDYWTMEVYDDHVIVCESGEYYSVDYTDGDEVEFDLEGATEVERTWAATTKSFEIEKADEERQIVFGWAYQSEDESGERIVDHSGEFVKTDVLEDAAYVFNLDYREGDERHTETAKAQLIESFVVTPEKLEKMGLPDDALPRGWWVGFHVEDTELFGKIRDGEYPMMSIGGRAEKAEVDADA